MDTIIAETKPKRAWRWILIIAGVGIALMGSIFFFIVPSAQRTFTAISVQGEASVALAEQVAADWNGAAIRKAWSNELDLSDSDLNRLMALGARLGPVTESESPNCNWRSHTGTGQLNGTFVDCGFIMHHEMGDASYAVGWRKEEGVYRLYNFRVNSDRFLADTPASTPPSKPAGKNPT